MLCWQLYFASDRTVMDAKLPIIDIFCSEELQKRISELEDQLRMKELEKPDETTLMEQKYKEVSAYS
jgi:hypothetical protein